MQFVYFSAFHKFYLKIWLRFFDKFLFQTQIKFWNTKEYFCVFHLISLTKNSIIKLKNIIKYKILNVLNNLDIFQNVTRAFNIFQYSNLIGLKFEIEFNNLIFLFLLNYI